MRVAVVGQGYVGLTAAVCLAEAGHRVTGIERDPERLAPLMRGEPPFFEPGIRELLAETSRAKTLDFSGSLADLDGPLDALIVAVGSPQLPSGGADLRDLLAAMDEVLALAHIPDLVLVKSTAPPGTSAELLRREGTRLSDRYVYSPEFLSQGAALEGWRSPARIVVGLEEEGLLPRVRDLYKGIEGPWVVTSPTDAEMIKYASNAFLATKISFVNEIANLCDEVGATIDQVVAGLTLDPRVGEHFLRAGAGYGGSCFPKDVLALSHLSNLRGGATPLLQSVVTVNNAQRLRIVRAVVDQVPPSSGAVAVLGLSFKPNTDDTREAPSLTVVSELLAAGYEVRVWDPVVAPQVVENVMPMARRASSIEEATDDAAAVVVMTEWPEITSADWPAIAAAMRQPRLVVDGRNCLDPRAVRELGLAYRGLGRGHPQAAVEVSPRGERS